MVFELCGYQNVACDHVQRAGTRWTIIASGGQKSPRLGLALNSFAVKKGRGHLASVRDQYIHDYAQAKLEKIRESEEQITGWVGGTDKGHEGN